MSADAIDAIARMMSESRCRGKFRGLRRIAMGPRRARTWTVSDQLMKRELILQGMGWGHMPKYLIEGDLLNKRLLDLTGKHLKGGQVDLVAARLRTAPHGPVAMRLWSYIHEQT
jgi:DNA-binding transcriptional LysR family regulator